MIGIFQPVVHRRRIMGTLKCVMSVLAVLIIFAEASAQNDLPKALLRANEVSGVPAGQSYYIEVIVDVPLKDSIYNALGSAAPPQIGLLTSKGKPVPSSGSFTNSLIVSPDDHGARTHFRMFLP